jgi:hypothetical protein
MIGNGPEVRTRSLSTTPYQGDGFFGGQYPGLGGDNTFSDFAQGGGLPAPFEGGGSLFGGSSSALPAAAPSTGGGLLNGLNMEQIKGFVDRMGGIEGIMGTMTKVQKFVGTFQQMAPMLKMLFSSFGGGKVKSADLDFDDRPVRRRKRRRTKSSAKRRRSNRSYKARISSSTRKLR